MSKAVIFDLDGIIVDTARFHFLAWRKLANDLGFDISVAQNEELKGVSRVSSLEKVLAWGEVVLSRDDFMRQMSMKNDNYLSSISTLGRTDILPGVGKVIDHLTENNIPFALGSASKNARYILGKLDIQHLFAAVIDGNDVSKAKPDPEVFLIAASKLNVAPENCIVFEDSVAGIQAANAANMLSIGIGEKNILQEADKIFTDFTEIGLDFLKDILK